MSGWRAALVALVVGGGILLTGWLVSRPAPADAPDTTDDTQAIEVEVDSDLVLACVPALEAACDDIATGLSITFETWSAGSALPEEGVVLAPATEFDDGTELGPVVAESPVVVAGWRTRWQPLELACGDVVDAACVASSIGSAWPDLGGSPAWGDFKLGLADPTTSEAGLLGWSLLQPEIDDTAAFDASLRLRENSDAELMESLVLFGDSRADIVVTTEVAVAGQFQNAINRGGRFEIGYPDSGPWIEYVAVGTGGGSAGLIETLMTDEAAQRFTAAGVRPVGGVSGALPEGLGEPGSKSPSPDDSTRATLISQWEDIE